MLISQQSGTGRQRPPAAAPGVDRGVAGYIESLINELSSIDVVDRDALMEYLFAVLDEVKLIEGRHDARPLRIEAVPLDSSRKEDSSWYDDLPRFLVSQFTRGVDLLSAIRAEADGLARCNFEDLARIEAAGEGIDRLNADNARLLDLIRAG